MHALPECICIFLIKATNSIVCMRKASQIQEVEHHGTSWNIWGSLRSLNHSISPKDGWTLVLLAEVGSKG